MVRVAKNRGPGESWALAVNVAMNMVNFQIIHAAFVFAP